MAFKDQFMWELVVCSTEQLYMVMTPQLRIRSQVSSLRFVEEERRHQNRGAQEIRSHTSM